MSSQLNRIPRTVILLALISFFADFSSEIYFAILPFFILYIGGDAFAIGVVAGITEIFVALLKALSGFIADKLRTERSRYLKIGYGLPVIFKFIMAFANSWVAFLILRLFERSGKGVRSSPRDAMIADLSNEKTAKRNFGIHRAMDSLGAFTGAAFAFLLISLAINLRYIIMMSEKVYTFVFRLIFH